MKVGGEQGEICLSHDGIRLFSKSNGKPPYVYRKTVFMSDNYQLSEDGCGGRKSGSNFSSPQERQ